MTIPEIIDRHLIELNSAHPGATLREHMLNAITEYIEQHGPNDGMSDELRDEIKRLEHDRDGWMNRFLARGQDLARVQSELADMRAARDEAVLAAHISHEQRTTGPDNKL